MKEDWLNEKTKDILIFLLNNDNSNASNIQKNVKGSFTRINRCLKILSDTSLIEERKVPNRAKNGSILVGFSRIISLTPKGKK